MLGWHISVYRQTDGADSPAAVRSHLGARLAVWQADWDGLDWLNELVKQGNAMSLGGSGYPFRYTAPAQHLIPLIGEAPPGARTTWLREDGDTITDKWEGKTVIDHATASLCTPNEWLIVEAWDES